MFCKNLEFDPEKVRIYRELSILTLGFLELLEKKVLLYLLTELNCLFSKLLFCCTNNPFLVPKKLKNNVIFSPKKFGLTDNKYNLNYCGDVPCPSPHSFRMYSYQNNWKCLSLLCDSAE